MEEAVEVLRHFGIPQGHYFFEALTQGLINQTFAVSLQGDRKYVLQKVNQEVFPNTQALEQNLKVVLPHLKGPDYAALDFQPTLTGDLFYRSEQSQVWRLMKFLPESSTYHNTSDKKVAFEAGRILGVFHRLTASVDPADLAIPLERFHDLDWRIEQYEASLSGASKSDLARTLGIREYISDSIGRLSAYPDLNLPVRVCHNDSKLNNILFSKDENALCLIDLDTLMPGYFAYDFGDAVRTIANPAPEEERDLSKIQFSIEMFGAFADGLATDKGIFKAEEIVGLPLSVVYMPFLHGLRAFTDFLLGNQYYKVSYPDENLDRARSLFQFSKMATDKQKEIRDIVYEKLL